MSEAPERIWVEAECNAFGDTHWHKGFTGIGTEYIRADLVEAAVERALDGAARRLGELSVRFDYNLDDEIQAILELDPAQFIEGEK